jgi:ArsR family transcriptional regulator
MKPLISISSSQMAEGAGEAVAMMKALANEHRLLILCHLIEAGELSAGALVDRIGLSQSALSQHLGKLREHEIVEFRREAQSLFYRVSDVRAARLLELLRDIFCDVPGTVSSGESRMAAGLPLQFSQRK